MGIFDFFKGKSSKESAANTDYVLANEQFKKGAYQECLRTLSVGFSKDVEFKQLYELSYNCLVKLGGDEEAALFKSVLFQPENFDSYNNLGRHFVESGNFKIAIPFLEKAMKIDSSYLETAHDLGLAYARTFRIIEAIEALEKNNPENDFWNYWYWCKLCILAGRTAGMEQNLMDLLAVLDSQKNQLETAFPRQKVLEVSEMLKRYEQVGSAENHIRDWQFIQYGSLILDFFDDSDEYVAGGRYVALWGNNESFKSLLFKLKRYIDLLEIKVDTIAYLNNRDSKIVALAIGLELGLEVNLYDSNQTNLNTLIVGGNATDFDLYKELIAVENGQVLFALNHNWLQSSMICPDIIGFMSQAYIFPWEGGGLKITDIEKGLTEETKPDNRAEEIIADDIFKQEADRTIESKHLEFYKSNKAYLKGIGLNATKIRENFMIESPLAGSYFG